MHIIGISEKRLNLQGHKNILTIYWPRLYWKSFNANILNWYGVSVVQCIVCFVFFFVFCSLCFISGNVTQNRRQRVRPIPPNSLGKVTWVSSLSPLFAKSNHKSGIWSEKSIRPTRTKLCFAPTPILIFFWPHDFEEIRHWMPPHLYATCTEISQHLAAENKNSRAGVWFSNPSLVLSWKIPLRRISCHFAMCSDILEEDKWVFNVDSAIVFESSVTSIYHKELFQNKTPVPCHATLTITPNPNLTLTLALTQDFHSFLDKNTIFWELNRNFLQKRQRGHGANEKFWYQQSNFYVTAVSSF